MPGSPVQPTGISKVKWSQNMSQIHNRHPMHQEPPAFVYISAPPKPRCSTETTPVQVSWPRPGHCRPVAAHLRRRERSLLNRWLLRVGRMPTSRTSFHPVLQDSTQSFKTLFGSRSEWLSCLWCPRRGVEGVSNNGKAALQRLPVR